jgi:hypothetical protein
MEGAELCRQLAADLCGNRRILQKQGALEKLAAVKSGAEDEVAVEQRSGLFEEGEDVGHAEVES